jgi:hypothetical protein
MSSPSFYHGDYGVTNLQMKEDDLKDAMEILPLSTRKTTTIYAVEPSKSKTQLSYNPKGGSYRWK